MKKKPEGGSGNSLSPVPVSEKETEAKRTGKATVFTDLFGDRKYLLQLYQALHPEDQTVTEQDINNVTIKNILIDQNYNDLGFMVNEKLVVLIEAQSTWTVNIIVRSLLYLAQTYQEYIESTEQDVYRSKRIHLPEPELYVIYTGDRKTRPGELFFSEEFFGGRKTAVEVRVKMIYDSREGDIINQYVNFTKVYNQQVREHGYTRKAIRETIRICKDRHILKEYLTDREKEVVDIMFQLFDDEYILRVHIENERREAAEKAAKEAAEKTRCQTAQKLYQKGSSLADIADILEVPVETVEQWLELGTRGAVVPFGSGNKAAVQK